MAIINTSIRIFISIINFPREDKKSVVAHIKMKRIYDHYFLCFKSFNLGLKRRTVFLQNIPISLQVKNRKQTKEREKRLLKAMHNRRFCTSTLIYTKKVLFVTHYDLLTKKTQNFPFSKYFPVYVFVQRIVTTWQMHLWGF